MTTIRIKVPLFVEPDGDGFYVSCPALPGLHTGGDTFEEAIQNGKDAVNAYLLSLMKKGESLPVGCDIVHVRPTFGDWFKGFITKLAGTRPRRKTVFTEVSWAQ